MNETLREVRNLLASARRSLLENQPVVADRLVGMAEDKIAEAQAHVAASTRQDTEGGE